MIRAALDRGPCAVLIAALLAATLDDGGARPGGMLVTHLLLVIALGGSLVVRGAAPLPGRAAAAHRAFLAFGALAAAAVWWVPYRYAALLVVVEVGAFYAAARVGAACGGRLIRRLGWPLLAVGAGQGLHALYQAHVAGVSRPAGTFLNPNHLAAWSVAALLLGVVAPWTASGRAARAVRVILALPIVLALEATASRGALLGLGLATLWWSVRAWPGLTHRQRRALLGAWIVLIAACGWLAWERAARTDPYRYHRLRIWRASLGAALDRPWTGVGPGQWPAAAPRLNFPNDASPLRYERTLDSTHSDLLRLPCEFGWPAMLAALAAIGLFARAVRRSPVAGGPLAEERVAVAVLLAMGGQALVDNLSQRPALYLLAAALIGALLARGGREARVPASGRGLLVAGALIATWIVADLAPFLAWRAGRADPPDLERSLELNPLHYDTWMRRAERNDRLSPGLDPAAYASIREDAETAVRLNPEDATTRVRLARLERRAFTERFGDRASRRRIDAIYREAQARAPSDPFIALERGAFLLDAGDPLGARRAAEQALALEPEAVPARLLLALALLREGDARRARRLVDEARSIAERWSEEPLQTRYAVRLLRIDPRLMERLERELNRRADDDDG